MPSRTMVSPTPRSQHNIDDLYEHADYQKLIYMYGELGRNPILPILRVWAERRGDINESHALGDVDGQFLTVGFHGGSALGEQCQHTSIGIEAAVRYLTIAEKSD